MNASEGNYGRNEEISLGRAIYSDSFGIKSAAPTKKTCPKNGRKLRRKIHELIASISSEGRPSFSPPWKAPFQRSAEENEEITKSRLEHDVTDEFGVKSLVEVMASALAEGRSVSILPDGGGWEPVGHVACGQWHPLVEVRRTRDKHTLVLPAARIVAVDVGSDGPG